MSSSSTTPTPPTQQQLRVVNDLTRASIEPGNLDYFAYCWYLISINHVKNATGSSRPLNNGRALNSDLQQRTEDRDDKKTDFRADQALWSLENLPEIIYSFERPNRWLDKYALKAPPLKTYTIYGKLLRDIPILPDHVSIDLEGWRLEAWCRFDPRVGLEDILSRIHPDHRPVNKSKVQMRSMRFREHGHLLSWVVPGSGYTERKAEIVKLMNLAAIDTSANTTRGLTWGLVNPANGPASERISIPASQLLASTVEQVKPEMLQPLSITVQLPSGHPRTLPADLPPARPLVIPATPKKRGRTVKQEDDETDDGLDAIDTHTRNEDGEAVGSAKKKNTSTPQAEYKTDSEDGMMLHSNTGTPQGYSLTTPPPAPRKPRGESESPPTPTPRPWPLNADGTPAIMVAYEGRPLFLKGMIERYIERDYAAVLLSQFYPVASEGRRRQLEYLLDPNKLASGFVDNRGYWPPFGYQGCLDTDIVYGIDIDVFGLTLN